MKSKSGSSRSEIKLKAGLRPSALGKLKTRTIKVDYLARVEGEGALLIKTKGKKIERVEFKIFEPPRYFEALLRGRDLTEAPDITSRICGICPIAYQMSSVQAMEAALGIEVSAEVKALRRLIFCGEWIESHTLHVYMLHAPDFLGFEDAIKMAQKFPQLVTDGLQLKKLGNDLMTLVGGREIHPINVRVGGVYKLPDPSLLKKMLEPLKRAREIAQNTVKFVSQLDIPDFERDYEFVSMQHPEEYPINSGRLVSNKGLAIEVSDYLDHFEEIHVERSNALHSIIKARGEYLVGPQARYFHNEERMPEIVKQLARDIGFKREDCRNPFKSIIVRSLEILFSCEESIRIIENYLGAGAPSVAYQAKAAVGHACTEAPRGILYHRYEIGLDSKIIEAKIIPPTSQNQKSIETDLFGVVQKYFLAPTEDLRHRCEQTVRNYDPCISCATHFLKIETEDVG
ncbi:MAG: Ni/Fe hydrogenase subunit alpha [Bdellovibrionales bacterium]|nr:Ni/Fe hydrogenase subunit alpha [Bdellovibrionales bacterium]